MQRCVDNETSNIYQESNADGHSSLLLYHIIDHKRSGDAILMEDKYYKTASWTKRMQQTTKGWTLLVQWHDTLRQWIDLKILKESNPIQVAEYATSHDIHEHPAFAWWVLFVLQKCDVIVSAVNLRVWKRSHKYGIELPCLVRDAVDLDCRNGNMFWADALTNEMGNVCVAFEILGPKEKPLVGWFKASGHIVFDVKMYFTCKA
jgi:hypothetical protein